MTTIADMMDALASGIQTTLGTAIPDLQVDNRLVPNPTPPSIDVYPGQEPFTEQIGFGHQGSRQYSFTVRARVSTVDNEAGQDLLLKMMDDDTAESVESAVWNVAGVKSVVGPTGFGVFTDVGTRNTWIGCLWRVLFIP